MRSIVITLALLGATSVAFADLPSLKTGSSLDAPATARDLEYPKDSRSPAEKIAPDLLLESRKSDLRVFLDVLVVLHMPITLEVAKGGVSVDDIRRGQVAATAQRFVRDSAAAGFVAFSGTSMLPIVHGQVAASRLEEMAALPIVKAVQLNHRIHASRVQGAAIMNSDQFKSTEGASGSGIGVAILDTGVNTSHSELAGQVTAAANYSSDPAGSETLDADGHGTSVAGIVAGSSGGLAPDSHLWAMKVLDDSGSGDDTWAVDALNDIFANRSSFGGIHVVNMSLGGGGPFNSDCDATLPAYKAAVDQLNSVGIGVFVASGNEALTTGISAPACLSNVIAVGAVYDANIGSADFGNCTDSTTAADKITCYSNSGNPLDILAPSHCSITPRTTGGNDTCFGGTSAACPYAAAVAAQILSVRPATTVAELESALTSTGLSLTDSRNGITRRRIDAVAAHAQLLSGGGGGSGAGQELWVATAANASGANNSLWKTDLSVLNRTGQTANLTISLDQGATVTSGGASLNPNAHGRFDNIVEQLLGGAGGGSLRVTSDQEISVTSRTFNQALSGTFGQFLDGLAPADGLDAGGTAFLQHLREDASFRTNIGATNMSGAAQAQVRITLYERLGAVVATFTMVLDPGDNKQENRPYFTKGGQADIGSGYAKIEVLSGSDVQVYASVVDNLTGDGTTIPMKR